MDCIIVRYLSHANHLSLACVCVCSQKLQLLKTEEISTPISSASFKTERLGLKMEVPSAQWLEESSVPNRQQQQQPTEFEYKQLVSIILLLLM